jgi:hypothetical protein
LEVTSQNLNQEEQRSLRIRREKKEGPVARIFTRMFFATASCLKESAYFEMMIIKVFTSVASLFQFSVENA